MAEPDSAEATIICAACGFANSAPRNYCQDCGAKLDPLAAVTSRPSSLPPPISLSPPKVPVTEPAPAPVKTPLPTARAQRKSHAAKRPFPLAEILIATFRTILYAGLAALAIQLARKPADMPPPAARFLPEIADNARRKLQESAATGKPVHAPWESVNSYLATVLQSGDTSAAKSVSFTRAAVAPARDGFALYTARNILGLRLYSTIYYRPVSRGGGTGLTVTGAAIGRIPLPEWAASLVESSVGGLDTALYSELESLRDARKVEIGPKAAVIFFSP